MAPQLRIETLALKYLGFEQQLHLATLSVVVALRLVDHQVRLALQLVEPP